MILPNKQQLIRSSSHHSTSKTILSNKKLNWISVKVKLCLLALLLFIIKQAECGSMAPSSVITDPHYFGSHYMKLNSMTLSNPVFPDGINSFQCPLGKIYSKIMSYTIILSSYQCDSTDYFGFKLSISIMTNPAATVNVTLEQTLNSKFSIIGVSAIIVTEPFDQVMKFLQFDMKIKEQWQTKSFPIPANYEWHFFVKSVSEKMIGNGFSQFTVSTYNRVSFILPTTVRMYFYSTTDYSSNAENYSFQVVLIILDLTAKDSFPQFNFLSRDRYIRYNTPFNLPASDFGIDTAKYGKNLDRKCIIGLPILDQMRPARPQFLFDLDPILGVINGFRNNINDQGDIQSYCFQDLQCPTLFPYKKANDFTNCWDCVGGVAVSQPSINNCDTYDPTFQKIQYSSATGQILSYCLNCLGCQNHYFAQNSICKQCYLEFPFCKTCNQKTICLTCISTHAFDTNNDCKLCGQYMPNCYECTDNSTCLKCQDGFYLDSNTCERCEDKIQHCNKCQSDIKCTECVHPMIPSTDFKECSCGIGKKVTGTCSQVQGCISSHMVNNLVNCYACDTINNWIFDPPNNCKCKKGYRHTHQKYCQLVCGDGIWTQQQCDDGNLDNEDGCSSQCTKEQFFDCKNVKNKKSICKLNYQLTSSVYSLSRKYGTGELMLKLSLSPYHPILKANNWPQNIHINTSKITLQHHEFQHDSILVLIYSIKESIEGQLLEWTLSYDSDKFLSDHNSLQIEMKGMNAPLEAQAYYEHENELQIVSYVVGGVAFLIAIVAMIKAQSNIGFEIVTTVLFIFYARIISYRYNSAILYTLSGLRVAGGFNEFFPNQHRDYLQFSIKNRFFTKSQLGLVTIFTLSLLAIVLLLKTGFQIKSVFCLIFTQKPLKQQIKQQKQDWMVFKMFSKAFTSYESLEKKFVVPITLICFYTVFFSFNAFQNTGERYQTHFGPIPTKLILLFYFIVLLYYMGVGASIIGGMLTKMNVEQLNKKPSKKTINISSHQNTNSYADLHFMYLFLTSILIFFTMDFTQQQQNLQFITEICCAVVLIYTIILLIFKPYDTCFEMSAIILNEVVKMGFLVFLFLLEKQILSQLHQLIGVYIFLGFLVILEIISIVRVKKSWISVDTSKTQEQELMQAFKMKSKLNRNESSSGGKKQAKKYQRDDQSNIYRYQNIIKGKKIKQQSLEDALKLLHKNGANAKSLSEQQEKHQKIHFSYEKQRLKLLDGITSGNSLKKVRRKQDVSQLQRLKQTMRNSGIAMKKQREDKMRQINKCEAKTGLNSFEQQMQKKYEYERWVLNNIEQAQLQELQALKFK